MSEQMSNEIEKLKSVLMSSTKTPILFLGAGFSYESTNAMGKLPDGKELAKEIFEGFVKGNVDQEQEKEIEEYNLQDMCETVNIMLRREEELKQFLFERLEGVEPAKFHKKLLMYPWKKIYTVNIDDLVENIYSKSELKLIIQNTGKEKKNTGDIEYIKLHGCVRAKDEPIVFSKKQYTDFTTTRNYKLVKLTTDLMKNDFIFVGANLEEQDIDYYFSVYEKAGFVQKGELIFINPSSSVKLITKIKALNGTYIKWTTEDFLDYINKLNYNPTEQIKRKKLLNYHGMYCYEDIKECFDVGKSYESKLYHGYECRWEDVFYDWVIDTGTVGKVCNVIKELVFENFDAYCISIVGNCFTGKSCILKQVASKISKMGYEVIEYKGKALNIEVLKKYIETSEEEKFVLLVDNASYYYRIIEKLLKTTYGGKKLLILATSREFFHYKKRYYLENNPFVEIFLKEKIEREDYGVIYKKLTNKGCGGALSLNPEIGIREIAKYSSFINLFSYLTYGKGFEKRVKGMTKSILESSNDIIDLFTELVIFDKADLPYYPSELVANFYSLDYTLFTEKAYEKLNNEQRLIVDNVGIEENGIMLKNQLLIKEIWEKISSETKQSVIHKILMNISSYISEEDETYWRIIFESLLKEQRLVEQFELKKEEVLPLFYGVKEVYKDISYYWLQLGIAEQRANEFSKALNHLKIAEQIRPRAYQIQHAIARNYLKHAYEEKNQKDSMDLFLIGERMMLDLINSREAYKEKAKKYSIHCYVYEKIRFMKKHPELVNKAGCRGLKKYIDMIADENDIYIRGLVKQYTQMLIDNNMLGAISMRHNDIYFMSLSMDNAQAIEVEDILIEAY